MLTGCLKHINDKIKDPHAKEQKRLNSVSLEPIPLSVFVNVAKSRDRHKGIEYEYKYIMQKKDNKETLTLGEMPANLKKNVCDIIPYSDNAVLLDQVDDDDTSVYINASWIDGIDEERKYLATQGPSVRTIIDFWRMIWKYNCSSIVMVTSLFEDARQQCEKYWPLTNDLYGDIEVRTVQVYTTSEYVVRDFYLRNRLEKGEVRLVRQFQFEFWPRNDFPHTNPVFELSNKLEVWSRERLGPTVIHCCSGSSRTGSFLIIHELLLRARSQTVGLELPIIKYSLKVCSQRNKILDRFQHYRFIYTVLRIWLESGSIFAIKLDNIKNHFQSNAKKIPKISSKIISGAVSRYDAELRYLNWAATKLNAGECAGGHRLENRNKSRDILIQPPDRARPYLISTDSGDSTDYINAVYIDGYKIRNQFIITQWPLKNTMNDLWRLIIDHQIMIMVVLNENAQPNKNFPQFWPDEIVQPGPDEKTKADDKKTYTQYGIVQVELKQKVSNEEEKLDILLFSILKKPPICLSNIMTKKKKQESREIVMLKFMDWPNELVTPTDCRRFLNLVKLSDKWNNVTRPDSPILIISNDGISRCGIFCVVNICLQRLYHESEVDVFRASEVVKRNRPEIINSLNEYTFCYTCIHEIYKEYEEGIFKPRVYEYLQDAFDDETTSTDVAKSIELEHDEVSSSNREEEVEVCNKVLVEPVVEESKPRKQARILPKVPSFENPIYPIEIVSRIPRKLPKPVNINQQNGFLPPQSLQYDQKINSNPSQTNNDSFAGKLFSGLSQFMRI